MPAETTAAVWRRRCMTMRQQRDDARAEAARLRAEAATLEELSRACPNARFGRRHAVRPARAPRAAAAGMLWCRTCHLHVAPAQDEDRDACESCDGPGATDHGHGLICPACIALHERIDGVTA